MSGYEPTGLTVADTASHCCDYIERSAVPDWSIKVSWDPAHYAWWVTADRFALAADVTAGDADDVGQWMGRTELRVMYCPFCGWKLEPPG